MTTENREMTAAELMELTEAALRITGTPAFASADYEGEVDSLQFVEADDPEESTWAFVPFQLDEEGNPHAGCDCCDHSLPLSGEGGPLSSRTGDLRSGEGLRLGSEPASDDDDADDDSDLLDDSVLPLHPALAADLIKSQLRDWLAERGWQVQLEMLKKERRWRLADCLSFTEGGGDRLETDYPSGDDELTVLCESVVAVGATG